MNPAESLALLACLVASAWLLVRAAIRSARHVIDDAIADLDLVTTWAEIREDFSPDEFELLRDIDRQMAGAEAAVLRERAEARRKRQARPYNWQEGGL